MAEVGRDPDPIVLEKEELVGREVVDPGREIADEAKELPRVWAFVAPLAGRDGFFGSGAFVVFGRVASTACQYPPISMRDSTEGCVRETLVDLLAIDPGGKMPERELVVEEVISRRPAWGMRDRADALA